MQPTPVEEEERCERCRSRTAVEEEVQEQIESPAQHLHLGEVQEQIESPVQHLHVEEVPAVDLEPLCVSSRHSHLSPYTSHQPCTNRR